MDLKLIKNLLDLIANSEVNEVSIEEGEFKIKIKKKEDVEQVAIPQFQMPSSAPPPQPVSGTEQPSGQFNPDTGEKFDGNVVRSPIVGTFYRSPSPDSDPFVKIGDNVEEGQTLCIIEAMKIMNEIESEFAGEIKKIIVDDGDPVEYDQPLFIIG